MRGKKKKKNWNITKFQFKKQIKKHFKILLIFYRGRWVYGILLRSYINQHFQFIFNRQRRNIEWHSMVFNSFFIIKKIINRSYTRTLMRVLCTAPHSESNIFFFNFFVNIFFLSLFFNSYFYHLNECEL